MPTTSSSMRSDLYVELRTGDIWKRRMSCGSTMDEIVQRELASSLKYRRSSVASRALLNAVHTALRADALLTMEAQVDVDVHLASLASRNGSLGTRDVYATIVR